MKCFSADHTWWFLVWTIHAIRIMAILLGSACRFQCGLVCVCVCVGGGGGRLREIDNLACHWKQVPYCFGMSSIIYTCSTVFYKNAQRCFTTTLQTSWLPFIFNLNFCSNGYHGYEDSQPQYRGFKWIESRTSQLAHQKPSRVGYGWRQWCLGSLSRKH